MAEGIVKWFSDKKKYGFIERESGKDPFVHSQPLPCKDLKRLLRDIV